MDRAGRRLRVLGGQVCDADAQGSPELAMEPCAGVDASSSYASATGQPSSYARVHGEVSRAPAQWRRIATVAREQLEDVIYSKAAGEGVAKVSAGCLPYPSLDLHARMGGDAGAVTTACPVPPADLHQPARPAQCLQAAHRCGLTSCEGERPCRQSPVPGAPSPSPPPRPTPSLGLPCLPQSWRCRGAFRTPGTIPQSAW